MHTDQLSHLLDGVVAVIREAGLVVMAHRAEELSIRWKEDKSPVTSADLASDAYLQTALLALDPNIPIVSEESYQPMTASLPIFWLVDPLDGTREFIEGTNDFAINIALVIEGQAVLGVMYAPARGIIYAAHQDSPAYRFVYHTLDPLEEKPIPSIMQVAEAPTRPQDTFIAISRHFYNPVTFPYISSYTNHIIFMGSTLKICAVAEGTVHVYARFGRTCLWDTAAGQVIVTRAGGVMVNHAGESLSYRDLSSPYNPQFCVAVDTATAQGIVGWVLQAKQKYEKDSLRDSE